MTRCLCAAALSLMMTACGAPDTSAPAPDATSPVPIANTSEGGVVAIEPASVRHDKEAGTTDIALKITYPNLETWTIDMPGYVEHKWLAAERVVLRFDCTARRFAVVRREALGKDGAIKEIVEPPVGDKASFQPLRAGGVAEIAVSRACPP